MRRLRFLRILLPAALVLFLIWVVVMLQPPTQVHREPGNADPDAGRRAEGLRLMQIVGQTLVLDFDADLVEESEDGKVHLENVARFVIDRLNQDPLIVSAALGDYEGEPGSRFFRFKREVVIRDPVDDLVLSLPALEVDEAAGEARCTSEVRIEGPNMNGHAAGLIYGLQGQPTELTDPVLQDSQGLVVRARTALLLDALDDVELRGEVQADRGEERFRADRLRWLRDPDGELRRVESDGAPASGLIVEGGIPRELVGRRLEAAWDEDGLLTDFLVDGNAYVRQGIQSLAASVIRGERQGPADGKWMVHAEGTVFMGTQVGGEPAWLRSQTLDAEFDSLMQLEVATAVGQVRFEGPATRAEADRATFRPGEGLGGQIRLQAVERPKARLARERIRVAGERITTDAQGSNLLVEGKVEATMLPGEPGDVSVASPAMFRVDEAVHFVSQRLRGENRGRRLTFEGGVRGWQGERNLAAETVIMDQDARSLTASHDVTTRIPRDAEQAALTEGDYVQIGADRLEYDEATQLAVYHDGVRVRIAEGWMEAERMEIDLSGEEERIRQVAAYDKVRVEFRDPEGEPVPRIVSGTSDRLTYDPRERIVRLFGDATPASVRRIGENGGTTTGRVLRYRLDLGTLEVDSGDQGPARIRTSGN